MTLVKAPDLPELLELADAKFDELFHAIPTVRVAAPGRVNLIGEHTDYNEGFVFPMVGPLLYLVA